MWVLLIAGLGIALMLTGAIVLAAFHMVQKSHFIIRPNSKFEIS